MSFDNILLRVQFIMVDCPTLSWVHWAYFGSYLLLHLFGFLDLALYIGDAMFFVREIE